MTTIINNIHNTRLFKWTKGWFAFISIIIVFLLSGCQEEYEAEISNGEQISISASTDALVLKQVDYTSTAITFNWTTGSNQGTGASISYVLEIDKSGNDFATAKSYDFGKQVYEKSLTIGDLNDMVANLWSVQNGQSVDLEARVTAKVSDDAVEDDVSSVVSFSVQTYKPVSESLYIIGDATAAGWSMSEAIEMIPDNEKPWIFVYEGQLSPGNFKFPVSNDECWCQDFYTQDPTDAELLVYNEGGSGDDVQWEIQEGSPYIVAVDLLELTISIEKLMGPAYTELYIVGDASASGWNIGSPEAFIQNSDDPFVFTYEGQLNAGALKFSTYQGDWCDGDWLVASQDNQTLDATDYVINQGCNGNDFKWVVTEETAGRYLITINLFDNTVKFEKVMLYLIGDGGPNGWDIGTPKPFTYESGVYIFNGELGADNAEGEFKISKFKGDWCNGDWINAATESQSLYNTNYIITHGCDGPDNKWKLVSGDAGTYQITVDLDNEVMTITKQ